MRDDPRTEPPADSEPDRPSVARVYDYFLGGNHNFEVDRQFARQVQAMTPAIGETVRANRAFLRRVVQYLVASGIDQFLDIGSGIPTVGNVHEIAQDDNPRTRVVYVDIDPLAVAYSRHILTENLNASAIHGDLRDIDALLAHPEVHRQIDLTRPVAVLLVSVLHFIPDEEDPAGIVGRIAAAVPSGSCLAISHATSDDQPREVIEAQAMSARTGTEVNLRTRQQITALFDGFELIEPGLVYLPAWHPDDPDDPDEPDDVADRPELPVGYGGLGRKP